VKTSNLATKDIYLNRKFSYLIMRQKIETKTMSLRLCELINNSTEQRYFQKANMYSASQEITSLLGKPEVHYSIHKSPLPILNRVNPVHTY